MYNKYGYIIMKVGGKTASANIHCSFLAHLSRRLTGELIVYRGIRRPSVRRPSVRQHFQTTSPLKP